MRQSVNRLPSRDSSPLVRSKPLAKREATGKGETGATTATDADVGRIAGDVTAGIETTGTAGTADAPMTTSDGCAS
jgi:hypothetical protein